MHLVMILHGNNVSLTICVNIASDGLHGCICADVLDPIKESRPLEISSGGLSRALGSSPISSITSGSPLKEKHPSALSQALGTSPSIR